MILQIVKVKFCVGWVGYEASCAKSHIGCILGEIGLCK